MGNWREWVKQNSKTAMVGSIAAVAVGLAVFNVLEQVGAVLFLFGVIGIIVTAKITRPPKGTHNKTGQAGASNTGAGFMPIKKIGKLIEFDTNAQKWRIPGKKTKNIVYNFSDVLGYEILEDADSITKGGLGGAVAGGLLFGGVGAVVGGMTGSKKTKKVINSLRLKITVNNIHSPTVWIDLITVPTKTSSVLYEGAIKTAEEIISTFAVIKHQSAETSKTIYNSTDYDVITNYENAGVVRYTVSTSGDERVCSICAAHDGKTYDAKDASVGKNHPPFHDKCRCVTLPGFDLPGLELPWENNKNA